MSTPNNNANPEPSAWAMAAATEAVSSGEFSPRYQTALARVIDRHSSAELVRLRDENEILKDERKRLQEALECGPGEEDGPWAEGYEQRSGVQRPITPAVAFEPLPPNEQETAAYNAENGFSLNTKETAAIVQMLRLYGWKNTESLQLFLHRTGTELTQLRAQLTEAHALIAAKDEALLSMQFMPSYDQDDAHRLRYKAKQALALTPDSALALKDDVPAIDASQRLTPDATANDLEELRRDKERLDWLEKYHMSLSRLTSPDMSGIRFSGQFHNPAKERGEAGPSYLRISGQTIRDAIDAARAPKEGQPSHKNDNK